MSKTLSYNKPVIEQLVKRAKLGLPTTAIGIPGLAKNSLSRAIIQKVNEDDEITGIIEISARISPS